MKKMLLLAAMVSVIRTTTFAVDVGDPVFPKDLDDKARAEIVYQNIRRDLDTGDELKADVYLLRLHTDVGQTASLDFDVGGLDPSGGDMGFYGGVGLRVLAHDGETLRVSPWIQLHFASNLDTKWGSVDYLDGDAGILFAAKLALAPDLTLMPYAGPVASIIRVDGENDADEDQTFGGVVGASLQMAGGHSFRVEGQIFDQASISAAVGIAF